MYQVDWKSKNRSGVDFLDKDELASILRSIAWAIENKPDSEHRIVYFSYKELDV